MTKSSSLAQALGKLKELHPEGAPASPAKPAPTLVSAPENPLSEEQERALECADSKLMVQAYAGSGKTHLLFHMAAKASDEGKKCGYLALNKSIAIEAQLRFGRTAICKTSHAFAMGWLARRPGWAGALDAGKVGNANSAQAREALGAWARPKELSASLPALCRETLNQFIASDDPQIELSHIPAEKLASAQRHDTHARPDRIVEAARICWAAMLDPSNEQIQLPHDGYLKAWTLSGAALPYDLVLLDEAQDTNRALLGALRASASRVAFVGDEHQAIYSFRGAVNAMQSVPEATRMSLTQTFRFGSQIANLANGLLLLKGAKEPMRARQGPPGSVNGNATAPGAQRLLLARTNAQLFEKALQLANSKQPFHIVGGAAFFSFPDQGALQALRQGKPYQHEIFGLCHSIDKLIDMAAEAGEMELALRAKLVSEYGDRLPQAMSKIFQMSQAQGMQSPILLSTVHKAKGLQAPWVEILPDFALPIFRSDKLALIEKDLHEEANILYVALTRAQQGIAVIDPAMWAWAQRLLTLIKTPQLAKANPTLKAQAERFALLLASHTDGAAGRSSGNLPRRL